MFKNANAFSSFSTNNLDKAKKFYSEILGLEVEEVDMGLIEIQLSGGGRIMIYPKDNHEPATFTVLNFSVADIEKAVEDLAAKGVVFEQYEQFHTDEKGIARSEEMPLIAWFKDPAGNILSVIEDK